MATETTESGERIDAYIASAPEYARPICRKLRRAIRKADRDIEEGWKWGGPVFVKSGNVCGFAAFKAHVALHFFKGSLMGDPKGLLERCPGTQNSRRIYLRDARDVDEKTIVAYVREAARLNDKGVEAPKKKIVARVPAELRDALAKKAAAKRFFDGLAPGYRREYSEYVAEAKRPETRERRLKKVLDLLGAKKTLNERYR